MVQVAQRPTPDTAPHEGGWAFRHEKIMDFFLAPVFTDWESAARYAHLDNYEPFIGVYELLAVRLPDDEGEELYRRPVDGATDTDSTEQLRRYTLALRLRQPPRPVILAA